MPTLSNPSSIHTNEITATITTKKPETNPCTLSPCKNNGKCNSENGQIKCNCTLPYYGSLCEHTRNPCQHSRCLNGGTCDPNENFTDYACSCQQGFKGSKCEKKIGELPKNNKKDH